MNIHKFNIADFNKAIELDPKNADNYNNRGYIYQTLKKYELAIADYTKAIELDSTNVSACYNRGTAYVEQKKYELAIADFTTALDDPKCYAAYNNRAYENRGLAYEKLNLLDLAMADYKKVLGSNSSKLHERLMRLIKLSQVRNKSLPKIWFKY